MQMHNPPHPGEVLREYMGDVDVTTFAGKVGVHRVSMSRLLNGQNGISAQMALNLAEILGTSPEMWMSLQVQYDLWHAREHRRKAENQKAFVRKDKCVKSVKLESQSRPGRTVQVSTLPTIVTRTNGK